MSADSLTVTNHSVPKGPGPASFGISSLQPRSPARRSPPQEYSEETMAVPPALSPWLIESEDVGRICSRSTRPHPPVDCSTEEEAIMKAHSGIRRLGLFTLAM